MTIRALVHLSQGGSDASWTQEYDLAERRFVPPRKGGFRRGLSKGSMSWGDDEGECVIVAADLGPGSLSAAGYPLQVRRVRRGRTVECGVHQHGVTDFRVANLLKDQKLLTRSESVV